MRFGDYLQQALDAKGISQRAFSVAVGYPQQGVNRVVRGQCPPPLKKLKAWADYLAGSVDAALFIELGELEHAPPGVQKLVADLRMRIDQLTKRNR
jgi:transcriptional regulator with XRE-family HTH domain